jgi:hypothetical protein
LADYHRRLGFIDLNLGPSIVKRLNDHLGLVGVEAGFREQGSYRHDADRNRMGSATSADAKNIPVLKSRLGTAGHLSGRDRAARCPTRKISPTRVMQLGRRVPPLSTKRTRGSHGRHGSRQRKTPQRGAERGLCSRQGARACRGIPPIRRAVFCSWRFDSFLPPPR